MIHVFLELLGICLGTAAVLMVLMAWPSMAVVRWFDCPNCGAASNDENVIREGRCERCRVFDK